VRGQPKHATRDDAAHVKPGEATRSEHRLEHAADEVKPQQVGDDVEQVAGRMEKAVGEQRPDLARLDLVDGQGEQPVEGTFGAEPAQKDELEHERSDDCGDEPRERTRPRRILVAHVRPV
jgi:hypothetical protein